MEASHDPIAKDRADRRDRARRRARPAAASAAAGRRVAPSGTLRTAGRALGTSPSRGRSRELVPELFAGAEQLVFFLAAGAVVRLLAPLLGSKATDPGVLVIDEAGRFVIPLAFGARRRSQRVCPRSGRAFGRDPDRHHGFGGERRVQPGRVGRVVRLGRRTGRTLQADRHGDRQPAAGRGGARDRLSGMLAQRTIAAGERHRGGRDRCSRRARRKR